MKPRVLGWEEGRLRPEDLELRLCLGNVVRPWLEK